MLFASSQGMEGRHAPSRPGRRHHGHQGRHLRRGRSRQRLLRVPLPPPPCVIWSDPDSERVWQAVVQAVREAATPVSATPTVDCLTSAFAEPVLLPLRPTPTCFPRPPPPRHVHPAKAPHPLRRNPRWQGDLGRPPEGAAPHASAFPYGPPPRSTQPRWSLPGSLPNHAR